MKQYNIMPKTSIYENFKTNIEKIKYFKDKIKECDYLISQFEQLTPLQMTKINDSNPIRTCKTIRSDNEAELVKFERIKDSLINDMLNIVNSNKVITNIEDLYDIADTVNNILEVFIEYKKDLTIVLNLATHKINIYMAFIVKMNFLQNYKKKECSICFEKPTHIVTTHCNHLVCEECLYGAINFFYNDRFLIKDKNNKPKCPTCRADF